MVLEAWTAPALASVDEEALRARARRAFGAGLWPLAAKLSVNCSEAPYSCPELGTRIPCRASLSAAMRSDPPNSADGHVAATMGVLACAAQANVGGQGCRFLQARRRFAARGHWEVYLKSINGLLDHVDWAQSKRQTLEWEQPRFVSEAERGQWRARRGLRPGENQLDPALVTAVDRKAPFFFDKSLRDLSLYLDLRHADIHVAVIPTDGPHDYASVYALIRDISRNPPQTSRIYAVQRKGIKLPPPFINFQAPLHPAPRCLAAWWTMTLQLMLHFGNGDANVQQVLAHLETGITHVCSTKTVAHPIWVEWLMMNPVCWAALGRGSHPDFRGPIALFRERELLPAP